MYQLFRAADQGFHWVFWIRHSLTYVEKKQHKTLHQNSWKSLQLLAYLGLPCTLKKWVTCMIEIISQQLPVFCHYTPNSCTVCFLSLYVVVTCSVLYFNPFVCFADEIGFHRTGGGIASHVYAVSTRNVQGVQYQSCC